MVGVGAPGRIPTAFVNCCLGSGQNFSRRALSSLDLPHRLLGKYRPNLASTTSVGGDMTRRGQAQSVAVSKGRANAQQRGSIAVGGYLRIDLIEQLKSVLAGQLRERIGHACGKGFAGTKRVCMVAELFINLPS